MVDINHAYPVSPVTSGPICQTSPILPKGFEEPRYIILQNLEQGFQVPCMLDIKLGTRMHCMIGEAI